VSQVFPAPTFDHAAEAFVTAHTAPGLEQQRNGQWR
jgi:hypothetical protein